MSNILSRLRPPVNVVAFAVAFIVALPIRVMAEPVVDFYVGKTITIHVGFTAGGGYDLYARLLAPFLTKHMPGKPAVIVKNMPGAGSLKLAVYMQSLAPRDGMELATVSRGTPAEGLLVGKINFDPVVSNWIGSMNNEVSICAMMARSGATTLEDLKKREFLLGTQGRGSDSALFAVFIKNLFGAKLRIATGYSGTNESILAMERAEVDGNCGWSWSTAKQTHPHWFKDKTINVIMQMALKKHPDLQDVPAVTEFARNDDEKSQIDLVMSRQLMGRPYFAPPAVPAERIAALRKAFLDAMADREFKAAAEKANLEINPVSGEEVQTLVEQLFKTPAHIVAAARRNTEF